MVVLNRSMECCPTVSNVSIHNHVDKCTFMRLLMGLLEFRAVSVYPHLPGDDSRSEGIFFIYFHVAPVHFCNIYALSLHVLRHIHNMLRMARNNNILWTLDSDGMSGVFCSLCSELIESCTDSLSKPTHISKQGVPPWWPLLGHSLWTLSRYETPLQIVQLWGWNIRVFQSV